MRCRVAPGEFLLKYVWNIPVNCKRKILGAAWDPLCGPRSIRGHHKTNETFNLCLLRLRTGCRRSKVGHLSWKSDKPIRERHVTSRRGRGLSLSCWRHPNCKINRSAIRPSARLSRWCPTRRVRQRCRPRRPTRSSTRSSARWTRATQRPPSEVTQLHFRPPRLVPLQFCTLILFCWRLLFAIFPYKPFLL